ncbi:hypothetical protein BDFG_09271, partial [Blastomyces dermatitidis ATCC 26199]
SSYVNRSTSANDSEFNIKSLIKNLKNMIIKKLSVLYITESFIFFSASSVTVSQSSTSVSVSDSLTSATSVSVTSTSATSASSGFIISAFIISSPHFKKMLYRLNKSFTLASETILIEDDNTAETILSHSQASSVTFSSFSAGKIVHTL